MTQTATPSTGILTVADAAALMASKPIDIMRLIAQGILPATEVTPGEWRILSSTLDSFVSKGAVGLIGPRIEGSWYADNRVDDSASVKFINALAAACEDQIPDLATLTATLTELFRKGAKADGTGESSFDFALKITTPVLAVLRGPVQTKADVFATDNDRIDNARALATYADFREQFLCNGIRLAAKQVLMFGVPKLYSTPINRLFETPSLYQQFAQAAGVNMLQRKSVMIKRGCVLDSPVPHAGVVQCTAYFMMSNQQILPAGGINSIIAKAF